MIKHITLIVVLCLLQQHALGTEWSIKEVTQLLGKQTNDARKLILSRGYSLKENYSDEQVFSKSLSNINCNITLISKSGRVTHIGVTEIVYDYPNILKQLTANNFQFRIDKSNNYIQTGWRDYSLDGKQIREPVGNAPDVAIPGMILRFDSPNLICSVITPADPRIAAVSPTMVINFGRK